MQKTAATIYCPNYTCQTPNPETQKFCQKCGTPLPKRYLWAIGEAELESYGVGDLLADRYVRKRDRILLDTKPGVLPEMPVEIPETIVPYLRLIPHRLQVPQVYGRLPQSSTRPEEQIWLLEDAPIYPQGTILPAPNGDSATEIAHPKLMPTLAESWEGASPMRQLNWLWQIASLWQPASKQGVAASLLNPALLRVEGSILRLLELENTPANPPLYELGQLWSGWVSTANGAIAPYLERLCEMLVRVEVKTAPQLIALLDRALVICAKLHKRTYHIATRTDQGPTRRRNEDACYPPSDSHTNATPGAEALAIVCDGIGGHEGGNVASNLAIEAVQQRIVNLLGRNPEDLDPQIPIAELERASAIANDLISEQNDSQQRQGRQRMGTTLVMALARHHELYVNHIGDSRAYWITRTGCRQVTLDDDVASREVRLGYALYRDALQQGAAGSLIQALGMNASSLLHPSVQRFIIDEDSVFLLCSDGLSDNDRVEQYWETEILPILTGELTVARAVTKLIDIGNFHNGHDNVTVAVVYCQVEPIRQAGIDPNHLVAQLDEVPPVDFLASETAMPTHEEDTALPANNADTKLIPPVRRSPFSVPLVLAILLLLGLGAAAWFLTEGFKTFPQFPLLLGEESRDSPLPATSTPENDAIPAVNLGDFLQIRDSIIDTGNNTSLVLFKQPGSETPANELGILPPGSVLQVSDKQYEELEDSWVRLEVCFIPTEGETPSPVVEESEVTVEAASPSPTVEEASPAEPSPRSEPETLPLIPEGDLGWIRQSLLDRSVVLFNPTTLSEEQTQGCIKGEPPIPPESQPMDSQP